MTKWAKTLARLIAEVPPDLRRVAPHEAAPRVARAAAKLEVM